MDKPSEAKISEVIGRRIVNHALHILYYEHAIIWGAHTEEFLTGQVKRGEIWLIHNDPYYIIWNTDREVANRIVTTVVDALCKGMEYKMVRGRATLVASMNSMVEYA